MPRGPCGRGAEKLDLHQRQAALLEQPKHARYGVHLPITAELLRPLAEELELGAGPPRAMSSHHSCRSCSASTACASLCSATGAALSCATSEGAHCSSRRCVRRHPCLLHQQIPAEHELWG
eukprot:2165296-Rhodomonas_salina.2